MRCAPLKYEAMLTLVDFASQDRIRRFRKREDAVRPWLPSFRYLAIAVGLLISCLAHVQVAS
jgi:hypothetical protein